MEKIQKHRRKIPGRFIFGVERRQAGALALRKHVTAPAKLAYAENTIRRPRSSENASWQRDNEPLPARKPYRGVERDRSMRISISFRSQDRWKIRDLEHDGCKTVSSLWIVWLFETWWIYRAFFSRWMEFHVDLGMFRGNYLWKLNLQCEEVFEISLYILIKYVTKSLMEFNK